MKTQIKSVVELSPNSIVLINHKGVLEPFVVTEINTKEELFKCSDVPTPINPSHIPTFLL